LLTNFGTQGFTEIVQLLINQGAKIDMRNRTGKTSIMYAAREGHESLTETLIKMKADLNASIPQWLQPDLDGWTALHFAVRNLHGSIAESLVKAGAAINVADGDGTTPLALACQYSLADIEDMLLKAGARVDVYDNEGSV
jgi:ankyrin repeat protein